jgi:hypothetical protein
MDIQPGSRIRVEITRSPRAEAARKTLTRLCAKDPDVARSKRARKRKRPSWEEWIRGGKYWHHQMQSRTPVSLAPGASYSLLASVDVIRDLESVRRFVRVSV